MVLTAQIQTLRRSAAVEALRLWFAHAQLAHLWEVQQKQEVKNGLLHHHDAHHHHARDSPVTKFLVGRVVEYVSEVNTLAAHASTKPSTWDAVSVLCVVTVPHLTAQLHCLRPGLRAWMAAAKSANEESSASAGCVKALALCSEILTLLPQTEDDNNFSKEFHRDGGRELHQQDAIAAIGRQLLRTYVGYTSTPLSDMYRQDQHASETPMHPSDRVFFRKAGSQWKGGQAVQSWNNVHQYTSTPLSDMYRQDQHASETPMHPSDRAVFFRKGSQWKGGQAVQSWNNVHHTLMGYRFHTAQTHTQRMTRLTALIDAVAALPIDTTLTQADWKGIHRTAMFAATSGASPLLSYHLLVRVFQALHDSSHESDGAFDRVAMLHGIEDLLCVLLPVVPVRQWLLLLLRIELSPSSILHDLTTAQPEWGRIVDVLSASICAELPLAEIVKQFEAMQCNPNHGGGDDQTPLERSLIQFPLPLLGMLVLENCISLSTSHHQFSSSSLPHTTDAEKKLLALAHKFGGVPAPSQPPPAEQQRQQMPSLSCGGCVHREALLASCHRMLTRAAHHCAAAATNATLNVTSTSTGVHRSEPSQLPPLKPRDVNLEVGGAWRRTIASAAITVSSCIMLPSSPHRLRHFLIRVLGGDVALPNPHHIVKSFFGGRVESRHHADVTGRSVTHLYKLWAGSVSSLWDMRSVIGSGASSVVGANQLVPQLSTVQLASEQVNIRLTQLMLSENSTNGVAHVGGQNTIEYVDLYPNPAKNVKPLLRPDDATPTAQQPQNILNAAVITAWYEDLQATGLLNRIVHVDSIRTWLLRIPPQDNKALLLGTAYLLKRLLRKAHPEATRSAMDQGLFKTHPPEHNAPPDVMQVALTIIRGDDTTSSTSSPPREGWEEVIHLQLVGSDVLFGGSIARAMIFERLLSAACSAAEWQQHAADTCSGQHDNTKYHCSGIDVYRQMISLLEDEQPQGTTTAVPQTLSIDPIDIPDLVHGRYFAAMQQCGDWEGAVAMVRRCQALQDHSRQGDRGSRQPADVKKKIPRTLSIDPFDIPDLVHGRYFAAMQQCGDWEGAVAMVRRCQALQDHYRQGDRGSRQPADVHTDYTADVARKRGGTGRGVLPSCVLGSIVVACLAANAEVPQDVRQSLLRTA
ncbi:Hypothetical protein, putative [Bodo saltans]|uniref:Uncharacterized protein n=1 Tax=Bodo saltans TaxID=75058 RepID=A0A0S4KJF4_BODSA|nr:Hypothetical protein, putative [Bodo saltans]|eukprot:CUI14663.1 Hypothetical protein, putative [Bodo saltans]